ncbi:MAG TPA: M23 family metallopeptidase [Longimicrobium sp.]|jgi:murein DD-endopeptidase MepM/ murein hydrolase activator NlpD|uniref:M23 family metallopeptidase n=1 Tax=Longimicrobium sp. TaxID=2029185 RepID=UPI002EDAA44D
MKMPRVTLRGAVIGVALVEVALIVGLAIYLATADRVLTIGFPTRASLVVPAAEAAGLTVPVAGVLRSELKDTYGAARSGGRSHKGVDIFAKQGTPVVAAAEGVIVKRDSNAVGGISVYQRGSDARTIYYYAHLHGYRPGLKEGDLVRPGDVIGYVGSTGNVSGSPHLHFSIHTVTDPNRWWKGRDLNPYHLLRAEAARPP